MRRLISIALALSILVYLLLKNKPENDFLRFPKMKGISLKGARHALDTIPFYEIKNTGARFVSITPYAFTNKGSSKLSYDLSWQYWGEKSFGVVRSIELARQQGLMVMLKPQVWIMNGSTGNMDFPKQKSWDKWLKSYRKYILHYASLAEEYNVAAFSIGSEFRVCVNKNRAFWRQLIEEVRSIYHGRITYSANWDEFQDFPLWESLDFIGVNAYFPLSKKLNPSKSDLKRGWEHWLEKLEDLSDDKNRPIVFTELGYRSMDYMAKKPWSYESNYRQNNEIQKIAYQLFFEEVWARPWMKGVFVWDWDPNETYKPSNNKYSPQGKPAEKILKSYFYFDDTRRKDSIL